jgi:hypothetical protein
MLFIDGSPSAINYLFTANIFETMRTFTLCQLFLVFKNTAARTFETV